MANTTAGILAEYRILYQLRLRLTDEWKAAEQDALEHGGDGATWGRLRALTDVIYIIREMERNVLAQESKDSI